MWARGSGAHLITTEEASRFGDFFEALGVGHLARRELVKTNYMVTMCCAEGLAVFVPRSGRRARARDHGRRLAGELIGWGLYSTDPDTLEAEVCALVGCHGRGCRHA